MTGALRGLQACTNREMSLRVHTRVYNNNIIIVHDNNLGGERPIEDMVMCMNLLPCLRCLGRGGARVRFSGGHLDLVLVLVAAGCAPAAAAATAPATAATATAASAFAPATSAALAEVVLGLGLLLFHLDVANVLGDEARQRWRRVRDAPGEALDLVADVAEACGRRRVCIRHCCACFHVVRRF